MTPERAAQQQQQHAFSMLDGAERVRWADERGVLEFWEYCQHLSLLNCGENSKGIILRYKGLLWEKTERWTFTCYDPPKHGKNWRLRKDLMQWSRTPIVPRLSFRAKVDREKERVFREYQKTKEALYAARNERDLYCARKGFT